MAFRILLNGLIIPEANIRDFLSIQKIRVRTHVDIGKLSIMEKEVGNNEQGKDRIRIFLLQGRTVIRIGMGQLIHTGNPVQCCVFPLPVKFPVAHYSCIAGSVHALYLLFTHWAGLYHKNSRRKRLDFS